MGRISPKILHSGGETIVYSYNIRNWTKSIISNRYYDNGNQHVDLNKGIAWIKYNLLNLPEKIHFQNGANPTVVLQVTGKVVTETQVLQIE